MLITRKKQVPTHWLFYAQLPLVLSVWANFAVGTPFLFSMKQFIDNPAAIMVLLSLEVYVTLLGGPLCGWLSDRIWTRFGRRKPFMVAGDLGKGIALCLMPFAPDLWTLIALRWFYGIVGDLGQSTLALTMEIVPPKQRGMAAGFKNMLFSVNNIVFSLLVIGRFHDIQFMGFVGGLGAEISGQTLIFILGAALFALAAAFEGLAIKEIRPRKLETLADALREGGGGVVRVFLATVFRDVLGRAMIPLYLLLFINAMFTIGLGVLHPLLYTEQWGYSMQDLGTNIAIGAAINVLLALAAGWLADRYSKIKVFIASMIGGLIVKVIWTAYVVNKPGMRPELWEILLFGEIAAIFSLTGSVIIYPLILDYVRRDRMGAATAGMGLFMSLIRNTLNMFVGFWVLWWSMWFMPQAGYGVEVVFEKPLSRTQVEALLVVRAEDVPLSMEPRHRPGEDGEYSRRWYLHQADAAVQELIEERKKSSLARARESARYENPATDQDEREEAQALMAEHDRRVREIDEALDAGAQAMVERLMPTLEQHLVTDGAQIRFAKFDGSTLELEIATVEQPDASTLGRISGLIDGIQYAQMPAKTDFSRDHEPVVAVDRVNGPEAGFRVLVEFDAAYLQLDQALQPFGIPYGRRQALIAPILTVVRSQWEPVGGASLGGAFARRSGTDRLLLGFTLDIERVQPIPGEEALSSEEIRRLFDQETDALEVEVEKHGESYQLRLAFAYETSASITEESPVLERIASLIGGDLNKSALAFDSYEKLLGLVEAKPIFLTVERPVVASRHRDRVYDYFLSGQTMMIATDIIGLILIGLIISMERRGILRRAGVDEDDSR